MTKSVATFWNLDQHDDERENRRAPAFVAGVRRTFNNPNFDHNAYDKHGDWVKDYDSVYVPNAQGLGDADVYFATCRPTLRAIYQVYPTKPIVVGGMFYPGKWPPPHDTTDPYLLPYLDYLQNVHGYVSYDLGIVPKWVDLLKAVCSAIGRPCDQIAVITDSRQDESQTKASWTKASQTKASQTNWGATEVYKEIKAYAGLGVQLIGVDKDLNDGSSDPNTVKHRLEEFQHDYPNGGVIVPALTLAANKPRKGLIKIINKLALPVVYPNEMYVRDGGLISLGINLIALYGKAGEVVGKFLQDPATSQTLTLWADVDPSIDVVLNTATAGGHDYQYDPTTVAKLTTQLANKIGPPWPQS
jgi:hypothetical protein